MCRAQCAPNAPDPKDSNSEPWTCKKLGKRAPGEIRWPDLWSMKIPRWVEGECTKPGWDCRKSKCCSFPGMQCYEKNKRYATCRESCTPGPDPTDANNHPWSCKQFGQRTPGKPVALPAPKLAEWVPKYCSKPQTNCVHSRCC